jgi:hypothetical protein
VHGPDEQRAPDSSASAPEVAILRSEEDPLLALVEAGLLAVHRLDGRADEPAAAGDEHRGLGHALDSARTASRPSRPRVSVDRLELNLKIARAVVCSI